MLAKQEISKPRPLMRRERLPVKQQGKKISTVSDAAAATASAIGQVCQYIITQEAYGYSRNVAVRLMLAQAALGELDIYVANSLRKTVVGKKQLPSRSTILKWVADFCEKGIDGVIKQHKGRVRIDHGWEALAVDLYNVPSKPSMAAIARDLRRLYAFACTEEQVRRFLTDMPTSLGKNSPGRMGPKLHKLQQKAYVKRSTENLDVGRIYMADGYRLDVYLAHPVTGKIWRAEIMHVIDVRTRYLVGYRIMAHERGYDIMVGWAEIFARWDHVPPLLYVDNGSGYKNKLADDELKGYYARAGVQFVIHSIPQNPHGKGHIEQYHRIVRDDFLKTWKPEFYCGDDMSDEVRNYIVNEANCNRLQLPTLGEFTAAYDAWIEGDYHHGRPHPDDKYTTRGQMWQGLDPIPPYATAEQIAKPQESRKVQRAAVNLHNRRYQHPDLYEWNGQEVIVEYDMLNHSQVVIRDELGRWICDAPMVQAIGLVTDSFMADMEAKALEAATARQQKKLDELKARAGLVIDADAVASDAQTLLDQTPALPEPEIEIDIFNFE